jgi:hypothetical protein
MHRLHFIKSAKLEETVIFYNIRDLFLDPSSVNHINSCKY